MADEVVDQHAGGSLPETNTLKESLRLRKQASGILGAFQRSGTIPTQSRQRRGASAPTRQPAPVLTEADLDEDVPTPGAVTTLADLRRKMEAPAKRAVSEDDDGGFDAAATVSRSGPPQSGASLAGGALTAMFKKPKAL